MNVIVCLHAPPPAADGTRDLGRDDALALALALAGKGTTRVTALLAGGASETDPLERALAAGADRAVRLAGEDLAGADFHTLGQALAGAIKRLGADLVLTGMRSDDEGLGAVPASTARQLGFVHVSAIEELAPGANDAAGGATVEVVVRGGGRRRRLRVSLPAVLSVTAGPPPPPPPAARTGDPSAIEVLSLVDPERTVVRRRTEFLGQPEAASRGTETVASAAALVAALLRT